MIEAVLSCDDELKTETRVFNDIWLIFRDDSVYDSYTLDRFLQATNQKVYEKVPKGM